MKNKLINILERESSMDKDILVGMITKTKGEIEALEGKIKLLEKEYSEANKVISIDKELIEQYKNFRYVYSIADIKQKKLLLQEVVQKITFDVSFDDYDTDIRVPYFKKEIEALLYSMHQEVDLIRREYHIYI